MLSDLSMKTCSCICMGYIHSFSFKALQKGKSDKRAPPGQSPHWPWWCWVGWWWGSFHSPVHRLFLCLRLKRKRLRLHSDSRIAGSLLISALAFSTSRLTEDIQGCKHCNSYQKPIKGDDKAFENEVRGDGSTCFKGASGTLLQEPMEGTTPTLEEWQTFSSFHKSQVCRRRCHCEKLWVFLTAQITFEKRTFAMYCSALASSLQNSWLGSLRSESVRDVEKRCNQCLTQRYSCFCWTMLVAACQCSRLISRLQPTAPNSIAATPEDSKIDVNSTLSGGEFQRLMVAHCILAKPSFIFLDEFWKH